MVLPPDFTTFWKQALQQGFRPKVASIGKAILFPVAVEALGKDGNNLSSEVWWSPNHPFKSSLTGMSAKDLAAAYEAATRKQWTQPIGFVHALFEVAVDVLKRAPQIAMPRPSSQRSPPPISTPSSARSRGTEPTCRLSRRRTSPRRRWSAANGGSRTGKYDIVITDNRTAPAIPAGGKMEPMA